MNTTMRHMESKQQTAVRKLINYITERGFDLEYEMEMSFLDLEEEQIMKAYDDGAIDTMQEQEGLDISMDQNGEESERYYKETYNK